MCNVQSDVVSNTCKVSYFSSIITLFKIGDASESAKLARGLEG